MRTTARFRWPFSSALIALSLGAVFAAARTARASDIELPRPVPAARINQQVGLTEIEVAYDCPATRGRKAWGDLVPYDRPWMTGSNAGAKIRFSREVTVGDKAVPAGTYALVTVPGKSSWTFILDRANKTEGDANAVVEVARVKATVRPASHRERLTFLFSEVADDRASLDLEWDDVRLSMPIKVNTTQQVEAAITNLDNSWRSFANAALYMLETKKDYDKGLKYIDESLALQSVDHVQDWYSLWIKGALLAAKGRYTEATELAQTAHELARASGPFVLEPELTKSIEEWRRRRSFEKVHAPVAARGAAGSTNSSAAAPASVAPAAVPTSPPPVDPPPPAAVAVDTAKPAESTADAAAKPLDPGAATLRRARLRRR